MDGTSILHRLIFICVKWCQAWLRFILPPYESCGSFPVIILTYQRRKWQEIQPAWSTVLQRSAIPTEQAYDTKNNKLQWLLINTRSEPNMHLQCVHVECSWLTVCFWLTHFKLSLVCRGTVQCVSITAARSPPSHTHTNKPSFICMPQT